MELSDVTTIVEGKLSHSFPAGWTASQYDRWTFYLRHFKGACCGNKAVDIVAVQQGPKVLWLVELKDYRVFRRTKTIPLPEEIALKVRDTIAGLLVVSQRDADGNVDEARDCVESKSIRVVLHLEQPRVHSMLFPREFALAAVQQKLRQLVRAIDPHPIVMELAQVRVPWTVSAAP